MLRCCAEEVRRHTFALIRAALRASTWRALWQRYCCRHYLPVDVVDYLLLDIALLASDDADAALRRKICHMAAIRFTPLAHASYVADMPYDIYCRCRYCRRYIRFRH